MGGGLVNSMAKEVFSQLTMSSSFDTLCVCIE